MIYYIILLHTSSNESPLGLKLIQIRTILCLIFYEINRGVEIRTRDCLVIKTLIPCQKVNLTQKHKLLDEVSR